MRFRYSGVPRLDGDDDDDGGCDEEGDASGDGRADVTFVIREERHPDYKRVGDDLLTTVRARPKELRRGCVLRVPSLSASHGLGGSSQAGKSETEEGRWKNWKIRSSKTIKVRVKPGEITANGQILTVKGRGWLKEKTDVEGDDCGDIDDVAQFGDLLVKVRIDRSGKRRRKKKKTRR